MRWWTCRWIGDTAFSVSTPPAADTAEAAVVDHYFSSSTENISVPVYLRTPGNRLMIALWCAVGPPVGAQYKYSSYTHTRLKARFPGLPRWAGTRKVKPIRTLLKQKTVSGSGISWAIMCKSAPCFRQTTTPVPHNSVFYRFDALPAAQPTASKHWRQKYSSYSNTY